MVTENASSVDNLTSDVVRERVDDEAEFNGHSASDQEEIWSDCAAQLQPSDDRKTRKNTDSATDELHPSDDRKSQKNTDSATEDSALPQDSACSVGAQENTDCATEDSSSPQNAAGRKNLDCVGEFADKKAEAISESLANTSLAETGLDVSKQRNSPATNHVFEPKTVTTTTTDNKTGATKLTNEAAKFEADDEKTNDFSSSQQSTSSAQKNIDCVTEKCSSAQSSAARRGSIDHATENCCSKTTVASKTTLTTTRTTSSTSTAAQKNLDCAKMIGCLLPCGDSTFSVAQKNLDCATSTTSSSKSARPRASPCRAAQTKSVTRPPTAPPCKASAPCKATASCKASPPCKATPAAAAAAAAAKQSASSLSNAAAAKLLVDMVGRSKSASCAGGQQCKLTQVCAQTSKNRLEAPPSAAAPLAVT